MTDKIVLIRPGESIRDLLDRTTGCDDADRIPIRGQEAIAAAQAAVASKGKK